RISRGSPTWRMSREQQGVERLVEGVGNLEAGRAYSKETDVIWSSIASRGSPMDRFVSQVDSGLRHKWGMRQRARSRTSFPLGPLDLVAGQEDGAPRILADLLQVSEDRSAVEHAARRHDHLALDRLLRVPRTANDADAVHRLPQRLHGPDVFRVLDVDRVHL